MHIEAILVEFADFFHDFGYVYPDFLFAYHWNSFGIEIIDFFYRIFICLFFACCPVRSHCFTHDSEANLFIGFTELMKINPRTGENLAG